MKEVLKCIKADYIRLTETAKRLIVENAPIVLRAWNQEESAYECVGNTGPVTFNTYTGFCGPKQYTVNTVTVENGNIVLNCSDTDNYRDYSVKENEYECLPVWIDILDEIVNLND